MGDDRRLEVGQWIAEAIRGIHFGVVGIVIHEGRVIKFGRKERVRFDRINPANQPTGGH